MADEEAPSERSGLQVLRDPWDERANPRIPEGQENGAEGYREPGDSDSTEAWPERPDDEGPLQCEERGEEGDAMGEGPT